MGKTVVRYSVCPRDCYDTCTMKVHYDPEANDIVRIEGDAANPMIGSFLCPRGAQDHVRRRTRRLQRPLIKRPSGFEQISFPEAWDLIAKKIKEISHTYGPEAILYYDYAGNQGAFTTLYPKRLWYRLGATLTDWSLCTGAGHAAIKLHYGSKSFGLNPLSLKDRKVIIMWGFNAFVTAPHIWSFVRKAQRRGTRIITIDVRRTRTAAQSDQFIQIRPHTDILLAIAIARVLIERGMVDMDFVRGYTTGFDLLKEHVLSYDLDYIARETGIDRSVIEQLAVDYASLQPQAIMIGVALQKSLSGWQAVRMISLLPALVGQHRGFFYSFGPAQIFDEEYMTGEAFVKWKNIISQARTAQLLREGRFRMVFVSSANPAITSPGADDFFKAMEREDIFTVVQDTHLSRTAQAADLVLPTPNFLEKEDFVLPWGHNMTRFSQAIVRTEIPTEIEQMWEIARRLGLQDQWLYEEPRQALVHALRDSLDRPEEIFTAGDRVFSLRTYPEDKYLTPSGKIEFYSTKAVEQGFSPLPVYEPENNENGFVLISSAVSQYTNSQFQEVYGPVPAQIYLHPEDMDRLGIKEGEKVAVYNSKAGVLLIAKKDDALQRGMVWAPRNLIGLNGVPLNQLAEPSPPRIGKGSTYNSLAVWIKKV